MLTFVKKRLLKHDFFESLPILAIFAISCSSPTIPNPEVPPLFGKFPSLPRGFSPANFLAAISDDGVYTTRDSVAAYLCKFEKLPANYRAKSEAKELYNATGKTFSAWNFNPRKTLGVMVGGDTFENGVEKKTV